MKRKKGTFVFFKIDVLLSISSDNHIKTVETHS